MRRTNKNLLDDLLEDSLPPELPAVLMDRMLRSARQRQRRRQYGCILVAVMLFGIYAFAPNGIRDLQTTQKWAGEPGAAVSKLRPLPPSIPVLPADPRFVVVQTSETDRPREIGDNELLKLLGDKPVALVRYGRDRAALVSFDSR